MRKVFTLLLVLEVTLLSLPLTLTAKASSTESAVVDMHGAKTWLGTAANWSKTWDEDNFEDVTGEDVSYGGNLTVKAGTVDDISVSGSSSKLTVEDVTVGNVYCNGKTEIDDSTVKSVESEGDITISKSTVRGSVTSDGGDVSLDDGSIIKSNVSGRNITLPSSATVKVSGSITGTGYIYLNNCTLKVQKLCGDDSGTLEVSKYADTLPPVENMKNIIADSDSKVLVDDDIVADSLYIQDSAEFVTDSTLELDTLQGPGTLYFNSGKLTVHNEITGKPLFVFRNIVSNGTVAFKADEDCVNVDDVKLYDYQLDVETSGGYDIFKLENNLTDGISFNISTLSVESGKPGTVNATIKPALSKYAEGTEIKWEIHGDDSAYSLSESNSGESCTVSLSSSSTGMHSATLTAYLVDKNGDRLTDYRSDSCIVKSGYDTGTNTSSSSEDIALDTTTVSILPGNTYWVLATTNASQMPHAMSYNSSIAKIGAGKAVKDKKGNPAWIYPVTGVSSGKVTINVGGQRMLAKVSSGIIVDTASYTMAPGGKYCIGVQVRGVDNNRLSVYTTGSCCSVNLLKNKNGNRLYQVTADQTGSGYVVFYINNGGVVSTQVNVKSGAKAGGKTARLVALA